MTTGDTPAELTVRNGHIVALRLFDIAYAIDLARAEALWSEHAAGRTERAERARLSATAPKAMAFGEPPLAIALGPVTLTVAGTALTVAMSARLYEFGAVTLALRVPASGLGWEAFADRVNAVEQAVGLASGASLWAENLAGLRRVLAAALLRAVPSALAEDYLMGVVQEFDARPTAAELLARLDLVPLLSGERRRLSEASRAELLRSRFSYYEDDLVVLTWDRAFIYEPRGNSDVADVLEVANAQLLEMRYYDELLDDELPRMYDLVEAARRGTNMLAARRYAGLARRFYTLAAEVTELTEKVDNALQVTEEVYLARIYGAALELFRVPLVSAAVDRKLAIIRDTYAALYDEASSSRSALMEMAIILLIAVELALALLRR